MMYADVVYGQTKIEEKILIDLINSKPMQRLKHISQGGPFIFLSPNHSWKRFKSTRFEHSVGVYILLKKFNASLEEQIAGLLHDVSHTVFSHSIDFLFNRHTQHDYHESFKEKIILNSEISNVLEKNGIDVKEILDEKKFGLLERELPDLCADRIDYFFRDFELYKVSREEVQIMFNAMKVFNSEIIFVEKNAAKLFAEKYIQANKLFWCNALQATMFKLVSDVVKFGIDKKILTEDDLFSTDEAVYNKLKNSSDDEIEKLLDLLSNIAVVEDEKNYDFHVKSKVRCTDPKVLIDDSTSRLSELDDEYKKEMREFVEKYSKGFFVRIIK